MSRNVLAKHQFVAEQNDPRKLPNRERCFGGDLENGGYGKHVDISEQVWIDMGRPETVTVTVEPGDRLNEQRTT